METESVGITEEQISAVLELRRARADAFGAELFGDVAWDILLHLYAARLRGRNLRLKELGLTAHPSTVARWTAVLEERGFVSCELAGPSGADLRLELSSAGAARMSELFRHLRPLRSTD